MVLTVQRLMWLLAAACLSLPLWSFWLAPHMPLTLMVVVAALLGVSAIQPHVGLLVLAFIGPMAVPLIIVVGGAPVGGNAMLEAMVLAVVAGISWRWCVKGPLRHGRLGAPSLLFGAVAFVSAAALVGLPSLLSWTHVTREYFSQPRNVPALHEVAVWVEALVLAVMIERFVLSAPKRGPRIALAFACGLAGEAVSSLLRLGQIVARSSDGASALWHHAFSTRISPHFTDVNAIGSLFALGTVGWAVVAVGTRVPRWERAAAVAGMLVVGSALWLTGSRSAIAASGLAFLLMWWHVRRPSLTTLGAALALAGAIVLGVFLVTEDMSRRSRATPAVAMSVRMEFAEVGIRMAADHPWLGVGLGEFSRHSTQYLSPTLVTQFRAALYGENAHNQIIQIAAELGLIGLVAFVWYWIRVFGPAVRTLRSGEFSTWLAAGTAGLCAFHLSAQLGHPFLTPYVVFCVFVSVGVVAGLSGSPSVRS